MSVRKSPLEFLNPFVMLTADLHTYFDEELKDIEDNYCDIQEQLYAEWSGLA